MNAIDPCPFCGGAAVLDGKSDDCRVRCEPCGALGAIFDFGPDDDDAIDQAERDAVSAWNRRYLGAFKGRDHHEPTSAEVSRLLGPV